MYIKGVYMTQDVNTITCQELYDRMQASSELMVINVLPEEMYRDCHIQGSINVPHDQIQSAAQEWDKNTEIVVYCAHQECDASVNAYHTLRDMGFANVREFPGGMREWKQAGLPVEGPCEKDYLK